MLDAFGVLSYAGHELADAAVLRGYRLWRSAYTMQIDLDEAAPAAPNLPARVKLRTYREEDAEPLREALNGAFADDAFFHHTSPSHFREFYLRARGFNPTLWLLAWADAELVGFVLAFPEHAGESEIGWVESLGVNVQWRGRGIGTALLVAAFRELHAQGLRAIGLGVNATNRTGALRLYERTGMRVIRQADNWALDL